MIGVGINLWQPAVSGSSGPPVPAIAQPSITSPANGAVDVSLTPTITSSAFAVTNAGSDTHASSDWQVASDAGFTTIIQQSLADAVNLESWTSPALDPELVPHVRVRHNGTTLGSSPWSASVSFTTAAAPAYDAASEAFFDEMDVEPSTAVKDAVNALVVGLKADGIWDDLDVLWPMAMHDAQAARLNIKAPASFALTAVNSPTFTAYFGYAGNGTTSYLNTGWDAATNGVQFTQNSASFGCWVDAGTDTAAFLVSIGAASGANWTSYIAPRTAALQVQASVNTDTTDAGTLSSGTRLGLTVAERTGSTASAIYRDGVSVGTGTRPSFAVTTNDFYIGCLNNAGTPMLHMNNRISCAFMGASLGSTKQAALYTRLNTFRTAMAAIP